MFHEIERFIVIDVRNFAILPVAVDDGAEDSISLVRQSAILVVDEVYKRALGGLQDVKLLDSTGDRRKEF